MFGIGHWELLIVLGIVLVLFGNRLPGLARSLGRSVVEFKKGTEGVDEESSTENAPKRSATE